MVDDVLLAILSVELVELFAGVGGPRRAMEHCGVVPALHVAVEGEAAAQRVTKPLGRTCIG